jgi:hypothetical protein
MDYREPGFLAVETTFYVRWGRGWGGVTKSYDDEKAQLLFSIIH